MTEAQTLQHPIPQVGRVRWIGVRPAPKATLQVVEQLRADVADGLDGDRTNGGQSKKRQVTLIQQEHLSVMANILEREPHSAELAIDPTLLRRNIVVSGINLTSLKQQYFQIGEAIFFGTGECAPCSRMEQNLGAGGWNAMRGHGGITARIEKSGSIRVGDSVQRIEPPPSDAS